MNARDTYWEAVKRQRKAWLALNAARPGQQFAEALEAYHAANRDLDTVQGRLT